ncbi:CoA-binding protein, partial [bacterium M00.F.Ca.ET.229.01.1.1]
SKAVYDKAMAPLGASLLYMVPEEYTAGLMARGMVPLFGISEAMDAAQAAAFIGWAWREPQAQPVDTTAAGASDGDHVTPDEAEAKARLIEAGLPVPKGERASNAV